MTPPPAVLARLEALERDLRSERTPNACCPWLDKYADEVAEIAACLAQQGEAMARDAAAFRWVSERAWFVDATAYAFDLRYGPRDFTTEPHNADADDAREAIYSAMKEDQPAATSEGENA